MNFLACPYPFLWNGVDCSECLPQWSGENCTECGTEWTGDNCDQCRDGYYKYGDTCRGTFLINKTPTVDVVDLSYSFQLAGAIRKVLMAFVMHEGYVHAMVTGLGLNATNVHLVGLVT